MLKCLLAGGFGLLALFFIGWFVVGYSGKRFEAEPGAQDIIKSDGANMIPADQQALELGRKIESIRVAIDNPTHATSLPAVTELGHDQRYYTMVRGWLSQQLQGDLSIRQASHGTASESIEARIRFLQAAIRAIDLE